MANTPDYSWPPMEARKVIGQSPKRLDGPAKASGRARYSSDLNPKDLLFGVYLTCPHAHARVTSVDSSAAEKIQGVTAVHVVSPAGTEIQWQGTEVAAVAAVTEEIARDAVGAIKVVYEVLPHLVKEEDVAQAGARAKAAGEILKGDPAAAFQQAAVVSEGHYGIPVITHCCLEPHGQTIQWQGDSVWAWPSTQDVTHYAGQLGQNLKVPAANVKVKMDYIGGGFGSKFSPDSWGEVCARLSQNRAGGRSGCSSTAPPSSASPAIARRLTRTSKSAAARTAPSRRGNRTPGPREGSPAAVRLRCRISSTTRITRFPISGWCTRRFRPTPARSARGARRTTSRLRI